MNVYNRSEGIFLRSDTMSRLSHIIETISRRIGAMFIAPSTFQVNSVLLIAGVALILAGLTHPAEAYSPIANYNDDRIAEAADVIMTYVHGSFGALIMVCSGIAAILSAAFGGYRAALGLLVVAVGSFILRSLVSTWFNDVTMKSI